MKTLLLNGAEESDGQLIIEELQKIGFDSEIIDPRNRGIASCSGCFGCWVKTPGICLTDDQARYIAKLAICCDLLVVITPVVFGCYSSEVKKALERLIPNISPFFLKINGEVHHKPRYPRYPSLVCIGILPGPDPESELIFRTLAGRNAINLHAPGHSAAIIYKGQSALEKREMIRSVLTGVGVA